MPSEAFGAGCCRGKTVLKGPSKRAFSAQPGNKWPQDGKRNGAVNTGNRELLHFNGQEEARNMNI